VAASLLVLLFISKVVTRLQQTSPSLHQCKEIASNNRNIRIFLIYFLAFAFLMKVAGEFVHEALGHGLFAILFGGRIVSLNISLLWPYRLSGIGISGNFETWQRPWIDGGGILMCLITSCVIQLLLLWKVKNWRFAVPLFWLAFWTFLNPVGYLIIGGIKPFGDIIQLIAEGILSQTSSLAIGLIAFTVAFFSLSRIFKDIVSNVELIQNTRRLSVALSLLWLTIPLLTWMAITGLGFLSSYSLLLLSISFLPSIVAFLVPVNILSSARYENT
jgi:hypothetical protein